MFHFAAMTCAVASTRLASVAVPLEVEPQLENVVVEMAAEAAFVRVLPLAVHDLERDVLVRRACVKTKNGKVLILGTSFLKYKKYYIIILEIYLLKAVTRQRKYHRKDLSKISHF